MKKIRKKNVIILALFCSILFMGVGYSLMASTIKITTTNEAIGNWDIYIESITATDINGSAVSRKVQKSEDGLSANFIVDLYEDGDFVEYTVVVKNAGTIKAKLNELNTTIENASDFIKMTNTAVLNSELAPDSSYTFTVKVYVESGGQELIDSTGTKYKMFLNYVQNTR